MFTLNLAFTYLPIVSNNNNSGHPKLHNPTHHCSRDFLFSPYLGKDARSIRRRANMDKKTYVTSKLCIAQLMQNLLDKFVIWYFNV